jgi:hypothetical protein
MRTLLRGRWRKLFAALAGAFLLVLLFAHPWFAVTRPSGGKALVAEGWMHTEGLRETAKLFGHGSYDRLYLTGTIRPFAYYLFSGDSVHVDFETAQHGLLKLGIGGLPGATWELNALGEVLLSGTVDGAVEEHTIRIPEKGLWDCSLVIRSATSPGPEVPVAFVARFTVDEHNVHGLMSGMSINQVDGTVRQGEPTYAEQGRSALLKEGVPADRITVVPTLQVERSRTWSSARSFTSYAAANGITRFDVATLGVHARRTWRMYRKAAGTDDGVGIISLHDRWCQRWTWWTNYYGWYQMSKELVAWPAPFLVEEQ